MNLKNLVIYPVIIVITISLVTLGGMFFSYKNDEISLRKEAEAQRGKIEGVYDKMWKILQQKAQVTDEYKEAFAKIYPDLIAGRYSSGDGTLMKLVTESNPTFDTSLYKDLMQSIESQREEFQTSQERMLDIIREHEVLINQYPSKWFLSDVKSIEYTVISSTKSKQTMETGLDDDVNLFKK